MTKGGKNSNNKNISNKNINFANDMPGSGKKGYLLIGVYDDGKISGMKVDDALMKRISGIRSDGNILPLPVMTTEKVQTDEERTFFRITIPCHEAAGNIIADIATREKSQESSQEIGKNIPDVLKDVLKIVQKDVLKKLTERQIDILELIVHNPTITLNEMSKRIDVSVKKIQRDFTAVRELGIQINRKDGKTYGEWEVLSKE